MLDFFKNLWESIKTFFYDFIVKFLNWLIEQIFSTVIDALTAMGEAVPNLDNSYQTYLAPYLGFINKVVPLDWAFALIMAYITIAALAMTIKWFMKFVPGF